jgi:peptidoglycan hydrolase CwlO-like protein
MRPSFITITILLLCLLFAGAKFHSFAYGSPSDIRERVQETKTEISELERVLRALETAIRDRTERVAGMEREMAETEAVISQVTKDLAAARDRLEETNRSFAKRVRDAYMKGGLSYLEVLLQAESFGDLVVRFVYLRRILQQDAEMLSRVRQEQAVLQERKTTLETQRQRLVLLSQQREGERRNLRDQQREKERLLAKAQRQLAGDLALITPRAERRPVYGIVLDNAPQARPQHGLAQASIVYEYEVEGGITRYLALFSSFPSRVGPVRSARSHSAILALENNVHFIYASAGVDVLDRIRGLNVRGTNALRSESGSFFRDNSRRAPHNLYVNLAALGLVSQSPEVVIRPAFINRQGAAAPEVVLEYNPRYRITYRYLPDRAVYRRFVNGQIHRDGNGEVIMARNIIVQYVPHGTDLFLRPTPELIGEGPIDFFAQGEHFQGTWKKENAASPTRFFFQDGQEIERVYGQTWIQIMRQRPTGSQTSAR